MKYISLIFIEKTSLAVLFFFSLLPTKIYCKKTIDSKIRDICLIAKSSVKSYFEAKEDLPEKYKNLEVKDEIPGNNIKIPIKLLLIDEETRNNYMQTKNNEKKYITLIFYIIIVLSIIIAIDFEIHFFLRLFFKKNIFEPSFTNFCKISPFYWILYITLKKQKANYLYNKFLIRGVGKKHKYILLTFYFIIFSVTVVIFIVTAFNSNEFVNTSQVTINVLCSSIKLLNELQNGKQINKDGSHLIGFKDIKFI